VELGTEKFRRAFPGPRLGNMNDAERFHAYAEECRKIAATLPADQKARLLEIAKAWEDSAIAAEAKDKSKSK
jgi:hypothetical protein